MSGSEAQTWDQFTRTNYVCVYSNGSLFLRGNVRDTGIKQTDGKRMLDGDGMITLILDTHHTPAYIQIASHSKEKIHLPVEWQYFRLCVIAWKVGQGVEILDCVAE
eukprot:GDKI01025061.1.p1 GENE.GDKI01025061.1~~GDKI01025061.1.p1  ORF type:complete len:106 (-),score=19.19 GDKI01025061.1:27-344(-)